MTGQFLLLPATFYLTAMTIFPLVYMVYLSFVDWNLTEAKITFVGLQNYVQILTPGSFFYYSAELTLLYGAGVTTVELFFGLGVALLLNREGKLAAFTTQLTILPLMMTPILIDMVWKYIYNPLLGPFTYYASLLGIMEPNFLDAAPNVFYSLMIVDVWQWAPFMMLILLAGLLSVPREQLEAAIVDGADTWTRFRHIILPWLGPVILVAVLFRLIDSFKVFNKIYILTAGGPGRLTETLSYNIFYYSIGFTQDIGYGATASVLYMLIVMAICMSLIVVVFRRVSGTGETR
jgi:multiple sugar transport system permease protein